VAASPGASIVGKSVWSARVRRGRTLTITHLAGIKESGLRREGAAEGLDEYLETNYICLGGINA
jgi:hypothetical protein